MGKRFLFSADDGTNGQELWISVGKLHSDEFAAIKTSKDAADTDAHILYDKAHGALYYDSDGGNASGRVEIAVLDNHASLTFQDVLVV